MVKSNPTGYIVETALLGQGLVSITNDQIKDVWPADAMVTWLEHGEIIIGSIAAFLASKERISGWQRLDGLSIFDGIREKADAFLTASAAMTAAREIGCPVAVTAGMGGIGDIKKERLCYDLPALAKSGITLVATSPKDMLDLPATIAWLHQNGVKTWGINTEYCDGYVFIRQKVKLSAVLNHDDLSSLTPGNNLILNPIAYQNRIKDLNLLGEAIKAGKHAEDNGEHYHPAANKCLDELSSGLSSQIQLNSLVANINIARKITEQY
jgi:pseudouridine-5'-phosphate glycosidase